MITNPEATVILIVDDDETKRYIVTRLLQRAGYTVIEAGTGTEALKMVETKPSLIVLDIRLPDMSGFDVCRVIKDNPATTAIPVLHLSASFTDSKDRALGLNLGADGYLVYPVEPPELIATVRALLRLRHAEAMARKVAEELEAAYKEQKRIAETLQRSLLINVPQDQFAGLKVATFYEAAWDESSVGGDFYDLYPVSGDKIALVVGDATGKGLVAATRTAEVKFALRAFMHEYADPAQALIRLNNFLVDTYQANENAADSVIVLAIGLIDLAASSVTFVSARLEPPLILRRDGTHESIKVGGLPLGIFPGIEYQNIVTSLGPGDAIVLVTDGVTEARSGKDFLSYEGMVEIAKQELAGDQTVNDGGRAMLDAARIYAGGKFQDDVCILVARRNQGE